MSDTSTSIPSDSPFKRPPSARSCTAPRRSAHGPRRVSRHFKAELSRTPFNGSIPALRLAIKKHYALAAGLALPGQAAPGGAVGEIAASSTLNIHLQPLRAPKAQEGPPHDPITHVRVYLVRTAYLIHPDGSRPQGPHGRQLEGLCAIYHPEAQSDAVRLHGNIIRVNRAVATGNPLLLAAFA